MNKNIILCLDGTGNQFKEDNSNIVKLVRILEKDTKEQIVYYDPGVGTLADPAYRTFFSKGLSKIKGLALGRGIKEDIKQAYFFIMNNYEDGDRIYIFGFSRGAYTARSVAGMIQACGLLQKHNINLIPYAIEMFQSKNIDFKVLSKFKSTFGRKCEIELLGLWDTVASVGWSFNPTFYPYTINNKSVKAVRHALSIDEKRVLFKPLLWGSDYKDKQDKQDIKEVWFAGVHSDVGGGYPENESGLAKISLEWMVNEISKTPFNLKFDEDKKQRYVFGKGSSGKYVAPDVGAVQHNSLKGFWKITQYLPIKIWDKETKTRKFKFLDEERFIEDGSTIHQSVLQRRDNHSYTPSNINFYDMGDKYTIEK